MRHARRDGCETLGKTARIATGGQQSHATHFGAAPGRTYSQIARQPWLESLMTTARDRSPAKATGATQKGRAGEHLFQFAGQIRSAIHIARAGERGGQI